MNTADIDMGMDPAMYYAGMGINLTGGSSALQALQHDDASMAGILENSILDDFENMPMPLESGYDDNSVQKVYIPQMLGMSRAEVETPDSRNSVQSSSIETVMTGAGAGPLPTGFGLPSTQDRSSGVTEFTKRRNWSQRVIEELRDFLHILTPDGRIVYLSPSGEVLTGYTIEELVGKFIIDFIHPDDSGIFVREFNESIASGHPLRFFYRFRRKDDTYTIFESHGHPHLGSEASALGQSNTAGYCRGFFMMARPYPTKNAALLDSFLEHKVENERLRKRINDLRREEAEDEDESNRKWQESRSEIASNMTNTMASSISTSTTKAHLAPSRATNITNPDVLAMPPPAKPSHANAPLTKKALEESNAGLRPDSIKDKMARFEGNTHIETIEMLTGLRYQDGERSRGISTGAESPTLIRGDAGIAIPLEKEGRGGDKKKKIKLPDEYVCTDCGTLDSPEWRKGPSGPKTLCNACGLRWAKKEKKKPTSSYPSSVALGESIGDS